MRLDELEPRWLSPNVFVFRCPACTDQGMLSLKNVVMSTKEQFALFGASLGERAMYVHPCNADMAWTFNGTDFTTMTASPSLNVEGHWHHTITNGEIK